MNNDIKKKANEAIEVAEDLPEEYKEKAFEVILIHLLRREQPEAPVNSQEVTAVKAEEANGESNKNDLKGWEKRVINHLPEAYIISDNGNRNQQCIWAVIEFYKKGEEASVENIRLIIKDELGLTPQNSNNTSRTLKNLTPKHLSRSKKGKEYYYTPTVNSIEIFGELVNDE
jgi:hypothetical protein